MLFFLMLGTVMTEFLTALRQLLTSKKFITTTATLVVAFAAKRGYNLDPEYVIGILGLGAALVTAQGLTDHGKESTKLLVAAGRAQPSHPPADATPRAPQGGRLALALAIVLAVATAVFIVVTPMGCSSSAQNVITQAGSDVAQIGSDAIDCIEAEATAAAQNIDIFTVIKAVENAVAAIASDWLTGLVQLFTQYGEPVVGCVIDEYEGGGAVAGTGSGTLTTLSSTSPTLAQTHYVQLEATYHWHDRIARGALKRKQKLAASHP